MKKDQHNADNGGSRAKLKRKDFEEHLKKLRVELCYPQDWVKATGARIMIYLRAVTPPEKAG